LTNLDDLGKRKKKLYFNDICGVRGRIKSYSDDEILRSGTIEKSVKTKNTIAMMNTITCRIKQDKPLVLKKELTIER
jgi:hypothetical protein